MQRMESRRRVGFSPDLSDKPVVSLRSCIDASPPETRRSKRRNRKQISIRLFHFVRSNVARALRRVSKGRTAASAAKGSSSNMVVPQHYFIPHRDSHHSEAMEDCIKFINSSSGKSI
ncbi:uncharacterized protein A4U43_C08F36360 [Asparagus officinalis]|nr:uncharacterized protein A4U43_C08F36360 [Asparagus officinalis]